jgi:hypothetical protein
MAGQMPFSFPQLFHKDPVEGKRPYFIRSFEDIHISTTPTTTGSINKGSILLVLERRGDNKSRSISRNGIQDQTKRAERGIGIYPGRR